MSAWQYFLYDELKKSADKTLAALAEKSYKEVSYHLRHASSWVVRLGDGTEESHRRMLKAIDELWLYTGDLFEMDDVEKKLADAGIGVDLNRIKPLWMNRVKEVLNEATLPVPENVFMISGSRDGRHTEQLGYILAEMQSLARAHPHANW